MTFVEDFGGRGPNYPFAVDAHLGGLAGLRRAVMAAAALFLGVIAATPASANHSASGTIENPCISPTLRKAGIEECGWRFVVPAHGGYTGYRVHSTSPADLDIHFYDASDTFITANPGPPPFGTECADLTGDVPAGAVRAIVVTTPNPCAGSHQWDVSATYTATP